MYQLNTNCNLAWAAGFFDGEGYVGCVFRDKIKYKSTPRLILSIAQVDRIVLDKFAKIIGFGTITGPYKRKSIQSKNQKDYYKYNLESFEYIQHIYCVLYNWLSPVKQNQFKNSFLKYHRNFKNFYLQEKYCTNGHLLTKTKKIKMCSICRSNTMIRIWKKRKEILCIA